MKQTLKIWIYEIDRKEVILDSYLAKLYNVETKRINETVKDNPEKFPRGFSWILPDEEKNNLWSKFSTANISSMSRLNPRVFTEQYQCVNGTKTINQVVKRNLERFSSDFYFQLNENEYINLKSQIGTSNLSEHGGVRKKPYVFTEHGVAMLATVITKKSIFYKDDIYDAYSVLIDKLVNEVIKNCSINN